MSRPIGDNELGQMLYRMPVQRTGVVSHRRGLFRAGRRVVGGNTNRIGDDREGDVLEEAVRAVFELFQVRDAAVDMSALEGNRQ